jgi:hypothetical protein
MSQWNGTRGGRFSADGIYQFPRTDAAGIRREQPIRHDGPLGPDSAVCELVPLTGGRPNLFSVEAVWAGRNGDSGAITCLLQGEVAERAYRQLVDHFKAGEPPPDAVPVPPDTPRL